MEIDEKSVGKLLIEGKTKKVFSLPNDLVLVVSKDRITAGDGVKSHEMEGKAVLSTQTNCALFEFLNRVGVETAFVSKVKDSEKSFVAKDCAMVPIEWVSRRVATGSFVKRNPNVKEGRRFSSPLLEHFFKDDANHDPFWSVESIIGAKLKIGDLLIEEKHVTQMLSITRLVFELLERVWSSLDHVLVDMKIEFGVLLDSQTIVVSDVIDNDSWRLWPKGEKSAQLDKQIYRDLKEVSEESLARVKHSFSIVAKRTQELFQRVLQLKSKVAIVLGSPSDLSHALQIKKTLEEKYLVSDVIIEVSSAHKSTQKTLDLVSRLESLNVKVIIACAGLSNGLGPVISGNCSLPVINCPLVDNNSLALDIWSSLRMPSGMGVATVLGAENGALSAALIVANENPLVWSRVRSQQTLLKVKLILIEGQ